MDAEAWRAYGRILFWLHRPDLTPVQQRQRCRPLWERLSADLAPAAVDPLHWLHQAASLSPDSSQTALGRLIQRFSDRVRAILHHGLENIDVLTSAFPHPSSEDRSRTVIGLLATLGDATSESVLTRFIEHPTLAVPTVHAIRRIKAAEAAGSDW
ncbi:hypothetical protein ACH49O_20220 [Streptomyces coeruleorubidus]|uniref:hypothetical protein n=1 Tax=Streptomyces coeruleorubidus TaxID=116188 RepID=UPI0033F5EF11